MFANKILNTCSSGGQRVGLRWQNGTGGQPLPTGHVITTDTFMSKAHWGELLAAKQDYYIESSNGAQYLITSQRDQYFYHDNGHIAFRYNVLGAEDGSYAVWWIYPITNASIISHSYVAVLHESFGRYGRTASTNFWSTLFGSQTDVVFCSLSEIQCFIDARYDSEFGRDGLIANPASFDYYTTLWADLTQQTPGDLEYEYHQSRLINAQAFSIHMCTYDDINDEYIFDTGTKSITFADSCTLEPLDNWSRSPYVGSLYNPIHFESVVIPTEYVTTLY